MSQEQTHVSIPTSELRNLKADLAMARSLLAAQEKKNAEVIAASLKLEETVDAQGDALDWSALELARLGGRQVPGFPRQHIGDLLSAALALEPHVDEFGFLTRTLEAAPKLKALHGALAAYRKAVGDV